MRALRCGPERSIDALTVVDLPIPSVPSHSVLVDVEAASVNYVDALMVTGAYQTPIETPFTPGMDFAGVVRQVNAVGSGFAVGDRVYGMNFLGAFAERIVVDESILRATPRGVGSDVACTMGSTYRTAYDSIVTSAEVRAGDVVAVLGASGAVGIAAIQVAKAVGARVIACASDPAKLDYCAGFGADELVDYAADDLKHRLRSVCPDGLDAVIDLVGGPYTEPALRNCRYGSRFVVVGFASGTIPRIRLNLVLLKGVTIRGYEIFDFERLSRDTAEANRAALAVLFEAGSITPPISERYSLADGAHALAAVAGRRKRGKIIMVNT